MTGVAFGAGVLLFLVALALALAFMNGFFDAAHSIATVVSTGALKPHQAVAWAAFFNVLAFAVFELEVAATVAKGIVDPAAVDHFVIFGALLGAIVWNVATWWFGIPSSSSHALIGGLIGASIASGGAGALIGSGILKVVAFVVLSPLIGFLLGAGLMVAISWVFASGSPRRLDGWFRRLQLVSSAMYSLGHGSNDAQRTMGILWLLLISAGATTPDHLPSWVALSCYLALGLGTLFGGWRIVATMGQRITRLRPAGGFCAETAGALTLIVATGSGIPVSTTQTITGAIGGVGAARQASAVRWGVAGSIVRAWVFTMPAAALIAAGGWALGRLLL